MTADDILEKIEADLAQLREKIGELEIARDTLSRDGSRRISPSSRRPRRRPERSAPRSAGARQPTRSGQPSRPARGQQRGAEAKRAPSADELERLIAARAPTGTSTTELAAHTGVDRSLVLALVRELERSGRIRRVGTRRGTRWRFISDEERIAERAAELAAQSRRFK